MGGEWATGGVVEGAGEALSSLLAFLAALPFASCDSSALRLAAVGVAAWALLEAAAGAGAQVAAVAEGAAAASAGGGGAFAVSTRATSFQWSTNSEARVLHAALTPPILRSRFTLKPIFVCCRTATLIGVECSSDRIACNSLSC